MHSIIILLRGSPAAAATTTTSRAVRSSWRRRHSSTSSSRTSQNQQQRPRSMMTAMPGMRRSLSSSSSSSSAGVASSSQLYNVLRPSSKSKWNWTVVVGGGLSLLWVANKSIHVVGSGQVGVVEVLGVVRQDVLTPGLHVVHPLATVAQFSLRPFYLVIANPDARVRGGLFVDIKAMVVYRFNLDKIKDLHVMLGGDNNRKRCQQMQQEYLEGMARSVLQSVIARRTPDEVQKTHQLAIAKDFQRELTEQLQQTQLKDILIVDQVVFQQVRLPGYFTKALEELHRLDLAITVEKRAAHQKLIQAKGIADYHGMARSLSLSSTTIQQKRQPQQQQQQQLNPLPVLGFGRPMPRIGFNTDMMPLPLVNGNNTNSNNQQQQTTTKKEPIKMPTTPAVQRKNAVDIAAPKSRSSTSSSGTKSKGTLPKVKLSDPTTRENETSTTTDSSRTNSSNKKLHEAVEKQPEATDLRVNDETDAKVSKASSQEAATGQQP